MAGGQECRQPGARFGSALGSSHAGRHHSTSAACGACKAGRRTAGQAGHRVAGRLGQLAGGRHLRRQERGGRHAAAEDAPRLAHAPSSARLLLRLPPKHAPSHPKPSQPLTMPLTMATLSPHSTPSASLYLVRSGQSTAMGAPSVSFRVRHTSTASSWSGYLREGAQQRSSSAETQNLSCPPALPAAPSQAAAPPPVQRRHPGLFLTRCCT